LVTAAHTLLPPDESLIIYGASRTSEMITQEIETLTDARRDATVSLRVNRSGTASTICFRDERRDT
jgi:hypothetical protein